MKRMLALILCCLVLAGCAAPAEDALPTFTRAEPTDPGLVQTTLPAAGTVETVGQIHFLTLYAPNEDATGFIYGTYELPERSPEAVCNALIGAAVLKEDVQFNSLTVKNGQVKLDVNAAFAQQLMSYGTAGEYVMMGSVVNTLLGAYGAETVYITVEGEILESGHVVYDFPQEFYENQAEEPLNDLPPMIMVDGKLYIDTGKQSTVTARCGMMDGTIESQVDSWQEPTQNNQSNFGIGFGYQYGPEPGTIEVNIEGGWYVYAAVEETAG